MADDKACFNQLLPDEVMGRRLLDESFADTPRLQPSVTGYDQAIYGAQKLLMRRSSSKEQVVIVLAIC